MNKICRIAIVDDHKIVRDGLKLMTLGQNNIKIIFEADSGKSLFKSLEYQTIDLLVLDIVMPEMTGIEITKKIMQENPKIKILILSANDDGNTILSVIEEGAKGFLSKDTSKDEFIKALNLICSGEEYFGDSISKTIYNIFVKKTKKEKLNDALSNREIEIIKLFSDGMTYIEIGEKLFISPRTVETHKRNIMKKLNLATSVDLVKYAIKNNIITLN